MAEKYIPLSAALSVAAAWCPDDDGSVGKTGDLREMLDELENIPPANVRPVVRGKWRPISFHEVACTRCGYVVDIMKADVDHMKFCNECGADMRPEPPEREVEA